MKHKRLFLWLAAFWILVVFIFSLLPLDRVALGTRFAYNSAGIVASVVRRRHHLVHLVAFALPSLFLTAVVRGSGRRVLVALSLAFCGFLIEWLQHVMYGNPLEIADVRDDVVASVGGYVLALLLFPSGAAREN
jgi:hypothetical protein